MKKIIALALGMIMTTNIMTPCFAATDNIEVTTKHETRTVGNSTYNPSDFELSEQSEEEIYTVLEQVYERTGAIPKAVKGARIYIKSEEELKQEQTAETRATTIPTKVMPGKEYESDWSGTKNYTYTKYLTPDYIGGTAVTSFSVDFYDSSSNYICSADPYYGSESDFTYVTGLSFDGEYGNVYAKFINKASEAADLASYILQRY